MTITGRDMLRTTAAPLIVLAALFGIPGRSAVGGAYRAATANSGGTILFARNNHWYTISPNGSHLHMLRSSTAGCPDFGCASFSPRGDRVMLMAPAPDKNGINTAIVNTDGSGYHVLPFPDRTLNLGPGAQSPDGTRIALNGWAAKKGRIGIYAVNASDGRGLVRLTSSPDGYNDDPLAYSPDGSRLLFFHEAPSFSDFFETTATGAGRVKLNPPGTQVMADFGSPGSWSPDGRQIAFTAFSARASVGQSAVFVEDANGTNRRRITPWGEWSTSAHWSPDGTWIVFDKMQPSVARGPHRFYLIHPNGTGLKAISKAGALCCGVWSPDGKKLLFGGLIGGLRVMNRNGSRLIHLTAGHANDKKAEYAWG